MTPTRHGSFRLFRIWGIDVFLHWTWFLIAFIAIRYREAQYGSLVWNALEYFALFFIVLLHELGHSLACRQVGGQADQIVLWPLGGVAYVSPPLRPGATLWSIAAGPLVNVALLPILSGAVVAGQMLGWQAVFPDLNRLVLSLWFINTMLLVFNLLPIYPLDGGQIVRSLLWFAVGRAQSDDCLHHRPGWRVFVVRFGTLDAIHLARRSGRIHPAAILERFYAIPNAHARGERSPPSRIRLSRLYATAASRSFLGLREVSHPVRYVCERGGVSPMRDPLCGIVSGMRKCAAHRRVDDSVPAVCGHSLTAALFPLAYNRQNQARPRADRDARGRPLLPWFHLAREVLPG